MRKRIHPDTEETILALQLRTDLTQRDIAKAVGVSRPTVRSVTRRGSARPHVRAASYFEPVLLDAVEHLLEPGALRAVAKGQAPAKPKGAESVYQGVDRQLIDPRLVAGVNAMLKLGFEPDEVARRVVRLIIQIAGKKYTEAMWTRQHGLSPVLTPLRIQAAQAELEANWGSEWVTERIRGSLSDMAEEANR